MNLLLWKILLSKQGKWQLLIAAVGFSIGLFILLLSVQLFRDLQHVLAEQQSRENQPSHLIINKQVSLLNTFDKSVSAFSASEIDTIRSKEFISSIGEFHTNQFRIVADLTMQIGFSTDLFFEAIPDKFIDNKPDEFRWEEEKNFIPVIISTEFLNLYNFGYSMTQNLPQLPPDAIKMIPFNVTISGNGKSQKLSAKVVAFSERIPSVLVPLDFMKWANKKFGVGEKPPSRLMIEVKDPGDWRLKNFLKEKKYQANTEQMKFQKAGTILKIIVSITGVTGLLFVILSLMIFILNFQLILSRAKMEVDILVNLGYTRGAITRILSSQFAVVLLVVMVVSLASQFIAVEKMHGFFAQHGFVLFHERTLATFIAVTVAFFMLALNSISLRLSLR